VNSSFDLGSRALDVRRRAFRSDRALDGDVHPARGAADAPPDL
jgi:hypothetical protein